MGIFARESRVRFPEESQLRHSRASKPQLITNGGGVSTELAKTVSSVAMESLTFAHLYHTGPWFLVSSKGLDTESTTSNKGEGVAVGSCSLDRDSNPQPLDSESSV